MKRAIACLLLVAGCAGPFVQSKPGVVARASGVSVGFCGSSSVTSVVKLMEPPSDLPPEVGGGGGLEPPAEAKFCLKLENHGAQPARLDRSLLMLKCPREKQPWVPDADDQEVIVHPGESKQLHVVFHYSPLPSGEDVAILLDGALLVGGRAVKAPALALRKK